MQPEDITDSIDRQIQVAKQHGDFIKVGMLQEQKKQMKKNVKNIDLPDFMKDLFKEF